MRHSTTHDKIHMEFFPSLQERNPALFIFGMINLGAALLFFFLSLSTDLEVKGVNAWYKPIKFALSTTILSLSMAWFSGYLEAGRNITIYNWVMIFTLGFEVAYIAFQASKGELSHYNISTPLYSFLFSMMALAATVATLWTAYIGVLFFTREFPSLPDHYLWAIRIGILLFVIFSLVGGFAMGANAGHTIGAPDGGEGLPFLNWSRTHGDGRIAHFIGMHALQVLPLLSFYLLKDVRLTIGAGVIYALLCSFLFIQALQQKPLFSSLTFSKSSPSHEILR